MDALLYINRLASAAMCPESTKLPVHASWSAHVTYVLSFPQIQLHAGKSTGNRCIADKVKAGG